MRVALPLVMMPVSTCGNRCSGGSKAVKGWNVTNVPGSGGYYVPTIPTTKIGFRVGSSSVLGHYNSVYNRIEYNRICFSLEGNSVSRKKCRKPLMFFKPSKLGSWKIAQRRAVPLCLLHFRPWHSATRLVAARHGHGQSGSPLWGFVLPCYV